MSNYSPKRGIPPQACADCALRRLPAIQTGTPEELACVQAFRNGVQMIRAGQTLIHENRLSQRLYTVYEGWAFRYKTLEDGRRQILNIVLPGDFVGLQGEFADEGTYGVEALTDLQLCVFPLDGLWRVFREQPKLGYDMTWLSARQEAMLDEALLTVGQRSAAERIAALLLHLWQRAEELDMVDKDGGMPFPLTQQHIADALGLSLVHTNKTLRKLEREGLQQVQDGRLHLPDVAALRQWVHADAPSDRPRPLI